MIEDDFYLEDIYYEKKRKDRDYWFEDEIIPEYELMFEEEDTFYDEFVNTSEHVSKNIEQNNVVVENTARKNIQEALPKLNYPFAWKIDVHSISVSKSKNYDNYQLSIVKIHEHQDKTIVSHNFTDFSFDNIVDLSNKILTNGDTRKDFAKLGIITRKQFELKDDVFGLYKKDADDSADVLRNEIRNALPELPDDFFWKLSLSSFFFKKDFDNFNSIFTTMNINNYPYILELYKNEDFVCSYWIATMRKITVQSVQEGAYRLLRYASSQKEWRRTFPIEKVANIDISGYYINFED